MTIYQVVEMMNNPIIIDRETNWQMNQKFKNVDFEHNNVKTRFYEINKDDKNFE